MILVDTNIIIELWHRPRDQLKKVFQTKPVRICGVVRAELLHGAKTKQDAKKIAFALNAIQSLPIDQFIWDILGFNLFQLHKSGIKVPFQDALLATLAVEYDAELWSDDGHFAMIQSVLPQLKLFQIG